MLAELGRFSLQRFFSKVRVFSPLLSVALSKTIFCEAVLT